MDDLKLEQECGDSRKGLTVKQWGVCNYASRERRPLVDYSDPTVLADAICYSEGIEGELITNVRFGCVAGVTK